MSKPKILYLPTSEHTEKVFKPEVFARLRNRFDVTLNETASNYTSDQVAERIAGFDGVVTGWGAPPITEGAMQHADALRIIAHSAGSVKRLVGEVIDKYIVPRQICVFSANEAIAYNVAEYTVGALIMTSRRWVDFIAHTRSGKWQREEVTSNGQFLRGSVVGIVSASKVGREVIKLLKPFNLTLLIHDPYLSDWDAGNLGVEKAGLNDLFARSDLVTIHAPSIPETNNMIGAEQLQLLRDGATLVNTSRGSVIDHDALLAEARTGRILITLDVTTPEPLPVDSPFRHLPNVFVTPHISGTGAYGYAKIGEMTLAALEDFFADRPVFGAVDFDRFGLLA
ncbi:MAG: hydroxyacid dehydrogenase [Candidatus Poribacteria bacterium]|nr:hydroxyacid dehydrogenase [Candidatus Poribacteria bacterium]